MPIYCRECKAPLDDFSGPAPACPGCGVPLNDKTIEIVDESGRPTPADFQTAGPERTYLMLGAGTLAVIAALALFSLYGDVSQAVQTGHDATPGLEGESEPHSFEQGEQRRGTLALGGVLIALLAAFAAWVAIEWSHPPESHGDSTATDIARRTTRPPAKPGDRAD